MARHWPPPAGGVPYSTLERGPASFGSGDEVPEAAYGRAGSPLEATWVRWLDLLEAVNVTHSIHSSADQLANIKLQTIPIPHRRLPYMYPSIPITAT